MKLRALLAAAAFVVVATFGAVAAIAQAPAGKAQTPAAKAPAPAAKAQEPPPPSPADKATIEEIQNRLLRLPYYGPFDFLAFSFEKGTVTLSGYAAHQTLKRDAERAVRQVARVENVVNNIEELPVSQNDDNLRWGIYYAIFSDPFLARYAPGGGTLWGHRHPLRRTTFGSQRRFPGMYPTGNYPISIIVNRGRVTLMGILDNASDKQLAETRARGVPGSFAVESEITIEGE